MVAVWALRISAFAGSVGGLNDPADTAVLYREDGTSEPGDTEGPVFAGGVIGTLPVNALVVAGGLTEVPPRGAIVMLPARPPNLDARPAFCD
jgi:hypothetical protein